MKWYWMAGLSAEEPVPAREGWLPAGALEPARVAALFLSAAVSAFGLVQELFLTVPLLCWHPT